MVVNHCHNIDHCAICDHVVYVLKDPVTGVVRYVGETLAKKIRATQHNGASKRDYPLNRWKRRLLSRGLRPVFEVVASVTCSGKAYALERELIARYAAESGLSLLNRFKNPLWFRSPKGKFFVRTAPQA